MASGDGGGFDNLPVWLKAAAVLGAPSIIAIFLSWQVSVNFTTALAAHAAAQDRASQVMLNVLIQNCANLAPTDEAARACFAVGRGELPRQLADNER